MVCMVVVVVSVSLHVLLMSSLLLLPLYRARDHGQSAVGAAVLVRPPAKAAAVREKMIAMLLVVVMVHMKRIQDGLVCIVSVVGRVW